MNTQNIILWMIAAVLVPVIVSFVFTTLQNHTDFYKLAYNKKQAIIGITFGITAILSTTFGVETGEGVIMNVRDASPLCAGLIFGAPAGMISGTMGALHRWLCVYWTNTGMLTRVACSISTLLAGIFGGKLRKVLFDDRKPSFLAGLGIGTTMEVLHMLLILITNLNDVSHAFEFVQICAFPMALCTGLSVCLAIIASSINDEREKLDAKNRHISYDFAFWLLVCVVIAFFATSAFTQQIVYRITADDAELYRHVTLYLLAFMEILIYTALFILVYQMIKNKVVKNIKKVNEGLNEITKGNLDTIIDVRAYKEFVELSEDVNATVAKLRQLIKEADQRIDDDLRLASEIQLSAMPSVFPPYPNRPDFDIYALMEPAKEVGGDFYDFYLIDSYTLVVLIADVSGKGIPAAMFMMTAKTLIKGLAESGKPIEEVFEEANNKLCGSNNAGMFITGWIGKLNLRSGLLEFVNAGHNPPVVKHRDGKFEYLKMKPNFILAGIEDTKYTKQSIQLSAGDVLFLYTDGVTEAMNHDKELFGEQRLVDCLNELQGSTHQICDDVKKKIAEFVGEEEQSDDITMLCVQLNATHDKMMVQTYPDEKSYQVIQTFLDKRMNSLLISNKTLNRMQVVNDEIWSNIVRYSGATEATLWLFKDENNVVYLDYYDNGVQFDPTKQKEPDLTLPVEEREIGGLGIEMVRKMTSSISYEYVDGHNRLTVSFKTE